MEAIPAHSRAKEIETMKTCEQIREEIKALGDCTNELCAGHDPDDMAVWLAILGDNKADNLPPSV